MEDTKKLIEKIQSGKNAESEFKKFLGDISGTSYSSKNWPVSWRRGVYELGALFAERDASPYLRVLKSVTSTEATDFVYSEIIWNFFEQENNYIKDVFKEFLQKYPGNPEFHHSYSHFLENNANYEQAIFEAKAACKIDQNNNIFFQSYLLKNKVFFDYLVLKNKLDKAQLILDEAQDFILKSQKGISRWESINKISLMRDRLHDYRAFQDKVDYFENRIQRKIRLEQVRIIEILGIFSAIITFILTNVTIALSSLTVVEVVYVMFGMALILMVFVNTISLLFGKKERNRKWVWYITRPKFLSIVLLMLILGALFLLGYLELISF